MKKSLLHLVILLSCTLHADVTNIIDIAALAACGTGTVNGWTVSGVDSYSGKTNVRLNDKNEQLVSPDFAFSIKSIVLKVKSSSAAGRRLAIFPYVDGNFIANDSLICEYSPTKDTYVTQTFTLSGKTPVRKFMLNFDNPNNGSTGWGISYIAVVTSAGSECRSPETITIDRIHTSNARISWPHNNQATSNLVTVSEVSAIDATFSVRACYDFEQCKNSGTNDSQDKSDDLTSKYPELSAEKIYYPASSEGILRISTSSANGHLTHSGYPSYDGMAVEITARRYDENCRKVYAYYVDAQQQPHEIGSIDITNTFTTHRIPLTGTPGGAAISIGNLDGFKYNRRFLIDQIAFLENYSPAITVTNSFKTFVTENDECRIHQLARRSTYIVTVTAVDGNGKPAKASEPKAFTTPEKDAPMMLRYR